MASFALARERTTTFVFSMRGLATLVAFGLLRNVPALSGWLGR
jgi:hypothetical protein